jgi:hypothetical protein
MAAPITRIQGIPDREVEIFSQLDLGAEARFLLANGESHQGHILDAGYRECEILENGKRVRIPFHSVETFVILLPDQASPEILRDPPISKAIESNREGFEKRREYLRFNDLAARTWTEMRGSFPDELADFRTRSWLGRRALLRNEIESLDRELKKKFGDAEVGMHYNRSGGSGYSYVERGGILATRGDAMFGVAISYPNVPVRSVERKDTPATVYYFSAKNSSIARFLADFPPTISEKDWDGAYVILFDIGKVRAGGRAKPYYGKDGFAFALDAPPGSLGVPVSDFLLPPIQINTDVARKLGIDGLSKQETQFATVRHLRRLLAHLR